jgi:glycosyltransferase involved in cell wall biosynthesis
MYSKYFLFLKSFFSKKPYSVLLYQSQDMLGSISKLIPDLNVDLIHCDTMGPFEKLLDHKQTSLCVLNHHNIESEMMFRRAEKEDNILKKMLLTNEARKLQNYEGLFCPRYDLNIVVSDTDKERLERIDREIECAVVENGVDGDYYSHFFRNQESKGLLFVGSLDWYPNADAMFFFLKEVWPLLKNKIDDLTLTIVGKNPPDELLSLVKVQPKVYYKGYVPDVREYVRKAKIFVCPIRDGGGTRLKILDALAQGIPVISTRIGCEGLRLKDGENVLLAETPGEFLNQIMLLLSDKGLCDELSRNGRKFIEENYLFETLGKKLSNLYDQLKQDLLQQKILKNRSNIGF